MPTIPKAPSFPDAAAVAEAKGALARAEQTLATLTERETKATEALTIAEDAAASAAVMAIELEDDQLFHTADAAAELAKSDLKKVTAAKAHAVKMVAEASQHLTRTVFQRHAGELNRLGEKRLGKFLKLEAAIEQVVQAYRAAQDSCSALAAAWPGPLPSMGLFNLHEITNLVEREVYRQSARPNRVNVAEGPNVFPGGKPVGMADLAGLPHKIRPISDEIVVANDTLAKILSGERVLSAGEYSTAGYVPPEPIITAPSPTEPPPAADEPTPPAGPPMSAALIQATMPKLKKTTMRNGIVIEEI